MKRLSTIIMALVLALGLTQCKKDQPNPNVTEGETYTINLSVKGNSNAKLDVNTTTGTVDYTTGDQIHVASGGKYVGTLTYNGTIFTGTIANAVEGEPLQFYFLGNVTPAEELTSGVTESCSVVITDQTQHLPVISGAPSTENFSGEVSNYTAHLLNKCALVKFNVTTASTAATCVTGFNNKVTIDFGENTFTNSQEGEGIITLPAGNGEQWAILLPQEAMNGGEAYSANESHNGTFGAVPAIYANAMFTVGVPVEVNTVWHIDPLATPLTLEAVADGTITFNNSSSKSVTYRINGGAEQTIPAGSGEVNIPVVAGNKVAFYGNSSNYQNSYFQCTSDCYIYGNIMSLVNSTGFPTAVTLGGDAPLANMFASNTHLINHPTKDLVLPATTLLSDMCYMAMFQGCTGLTRAPELPATTLSRMCYANMFQGCTGLTTAPVLPATTLKNDCYNSMFSGCSNLNSVTCLATNISASGCTSNWLASVAATGTFNRNEAMTGWTLNSPSGIPSGWTVVPPVVTIIDLSTLTSNTIVEDGTILTGMLDAYYSSSKCIKISIADNATVTLSNATINGRGSASYQWAGLTCLGNATIILEGSNTVKGFYENCPGIEAGPQGSTLTIKGNGSLNVSSNNDINAYGAGIGGGCVETGPAIVYGNIVIEGGTINATGGIVGAGIGGGYGSSCGNITITGGTITATGGMAGAGIGGGFGTNCGDITIANTVNRVTATRGSSAPNSIGAGLSGTCGTVTIGGVVTGNISTSPYTYQPQP